MLHDSNKFSILKRGTVKPKSGFLLNTLLHIRPLTFINEAFRLSGSPFVVSTASP